ncbi:hypothetical protein TNCV_2027901 [Trichonephila clavipes]|nr:hypothetical protein TNCV_2027901 [Trichonephila clavipes]
MFTSPSEGEVFQPQRLQPYSARTHDMLVMIRYLDNWTTAALEEEVTGGMGYGRIMRYVRVPVVLSFSSVAVLVEKQLSYYHLSPSGWDALKMYTTAGRTTIKI